MQTLSRWNQIYANDSEHLDRSSWRKKNRKAKNEKKKSWPQERRRGDPRDRLQLSYSNCSLLFSAQDTWFQQSVTYLWVKQCGKPGLYWCKKHSLFRARPIRNMLRRRTWNLSKIFRDQNRCPSLGRFINIFPSSVRTVFRPEKNFIYIRTRWKTDW